MSNTNEQLKEFDSMLNNGVKFKAGKRQFYIKEPSLGTIIELSRLYMKMGYDEGKIQEDPLGQSKIIAAEHGYTCARIVATIVLGNYWRVGIIRRFFTWYFLLKIKPSKMAELAWIINAMCNYANFINSIRLMSVARSAAPGRIEEEKLG